MTIPGIESPLRSVAHSKGARTLGLGLLLIVDIVIILWMTSGRPSGISFINPLRAPLSNSEDVRSAEDQVGQRQASTRGNSDARGSATTAVRTPDAPADNVGVDGGASLLESLGASAAPPFTRGATPVQPRDRTRTRRPATPAVVVASGGGSGGSSSLRPGLPSAPAGVFPTLPPTVIESGSSPLLPLPVSAGPTFPPPEDPTPTRPVADPTPNPPADPTNPPRSDPTPTDPPAEPTDPPAEPTDPPADPTNPPADPTEPPADPTDPPVEPDPTPTEEPTAEVTPTSEPTSTRTKCADTPCRG